jgi:hypothetical protein
MRLTDAETRAFQVLRSQIRATEAIVSDPMRSDYGKRKDLGHARIALRADLHTLTEGARARSARACHDASYSMRGFKGSGGADLVAWRDALDRAAGCETPAEARAVWLRAEANGDTQLATAVAMAAMEHFTSDPIVGRGWGDITSAWLERHPEHIPAMQVLSDEMDTRAHLERTISERLLMEMPPAPAGYEDAERIAAEADRQAQAA